MMPRTRTPGLSILLCSGALACLLCAPALAQPTADRSALEAKRKAQEEKRREIEKLRKAKTAETADQREERLRMAAKDRNRQAALAKAQEAQKAAARRQNRKAYTLMTEAWKLDPENMDYSFFAAALAEAIKDVEGEFFAYAAFVNTAARLLEQIGAEPSDYRNTVLERVQKAKERMNLLRQRLTTGKVIIEARPEKCEIYLDGAFLGTGKGEIEMVAGQRRVRVSCQGFVDLDQYLNVRAGDANRHLLRPTPIPYYGYLIFKVKPADGVTIFLDDVPIENRLGPKPTKAGKITGTGSRKDPIRLLARKWIIRFKKDGYDRWHRRITIVRDQITTVNAALERMANNVEATGN